MCCIAPPRGDEKNDGAFSGGGDVSIPPTASLHRISLRLLRKMSDLPPLLTVWTADHDRRLKNLISRDYRYRRAGKTDWHDYCLKQMANLKAYGMETLPTDEKPEDYPVAHASATDSPIITTTTDATPKGNKKTSIYGPKPKVGQVLVANGGAGAPPAPAPPAPKKVSQAKRDEATRKAVAEGIANRTPKEKAKAEIHRRIAEEEERDGIATPESTIGLDGRIASAEKVNTAWREAGLVDPPPRVPTPPPAEPSEDEEEEDEDDDEDEEEEEREHDTASYASEHSVAEEPVADAPANGGAGAPPTAKPKSTRKCSKCSKPGHQARTCPN
jgi:hypothetical protein